MKVKKTIYICNVCGKEHELETDAIHCHPDIVEKRVDYIRYKSRGGKVKEKRVYAES